jgi:AcrR family transcriptional regulator
MAVQKRRAKEKVERAASILDAAEQVFFRKGFNQTSMDEIAQCAALSRALLYVYFKDKAAIMRGIMLRAAQEMESRFEEAIRSKPTGLEQISSIGRSYYRFSREASDYFDVLTDMVNFPIPEEPDEQMQQLGCCREQITELMVTALRHGLEDGTIDRQRVHNPVLTAYFLQGALHGVIMQTRRHLDPTHEYPDSDALVNYTIDMLTESMRGL